MIKIGFFDKINYSTIVNAFKRVCDRRHREVFFTMSCKLRHSANICFTVSEIPQDWQVGGSSPDNKYEWVRRKWPMSYREKYASCRTRPPEFPYNIIQDTPRIACVPKTSSIHPAISIWSRHVTDGQPDLRRDTGHSICRASYSASRGKNRSEWVKTEKDGRRLT